MEPPEAKRTRRSSTSSTGSARGARPPERLITEAAPRTRAEVLSATKQLHCIGASVPPRMEHGVLGDVQLYIPYINIRKPQAEAPFPLPSGRAKVRVKWWGEEGEGMELEPKMTSHTNYLSKEPLDWKNCCLFPVRIDSEHFTAYLKDMQHLVLEVVDAESGAVVGKSLYPVMERSVKPRRLPVYLCEAGGGGADEQGRKRGPCIGDVLVQLLIRMGVQSPLRRVVAALVQQQGQGPLVQAVRRSLRPEDAQVLEGLVSSVLSQPPDGHLLDQLVSPAPPTAEAREAQQDALWTFQLDEAMAQADAHDQLPTWPQQPHRPLYTAPESQGVALQAGTLMPPPPPTAPEGGLATALLHPAGMLAGQMPEPSPGGIARPAPPRPALPGQQQPEQGSPAFAEGREGVAHDDEEEADEWATGGGAARLLPEPARRARVEQPPPPAPPSLSGGADELIDSLLARGRHLRDAMRAATGAAAVSRGGGEAGGLRSEPQSWARALQTAGRAAVGRAVEDGEEDDVVLGQGGAAGLPLEYGRVASEAIWPMMEGMEGEVSDEEDDLVRSLLQGGDKKAFEARSRYPALAAAERTRLECLEKARFMVIALPGLSLLQAPRPPRRIIVRYTLPRHTSTPPLASQQKDRIVDCAFVPSEQQRDRRLAPPHPGSYSPEGSSTPVCLAVEVTDVVLNAWLDQALDLLVLVAHRDLDPDAHRRLPRPTQAGRGGGAKAQKPASGPAAPRPPDELIIVARARLMLRDLVLSPYLSIASTLEMVREEAAEPLTFTWKTAEGLGGRTILGTLNLEMSLVPPDLAAPQGGAAQGLSESSSLPHFGPRPTLHAPLPATPQPAASAGAASTGGAAASPPSPPTQLLLEVGRLRFQTAQQAREYGGSPLSLRFWDPSSSLGEDQAAAPRARHELRCRGRGGQEQQQLDFDHSMRSSLPPVSPRLLEQLRTQPLVLEVWTIASSPANTAPRLVGLVKVPLAPLCEGLSSSSTRRLLPAMAEHGWRDVINPFSGQAVAQLHLTVAAGTEPQVDRLAKAAAPLRRFQARVRGAMTRKTRRVRRTARLSAILKGGAATSSPAKAAQAPATEAAQPADRHAQARARTGRAATPTYEEDEEDEEEVEVEEEGREELEVSGISGGSGLLSSSGGSREGGGAGDWLVKHVVEVTVRGQCPLQGPLSDTASCYVRYFVPLHPNATVLAEAALARNDGMLDAHGPRPGGAKGGMMLEKAVCLWWDLDDSDMNSRARHVLHVPPGQPVHDLLCVAQEEGIHFEVWLAGMVDGPARRLVGTSVLSRRSLARLTQEEMATRTFRLQLSSEDGGDASSMPLDHVDVTLSYHREPGLVARASRRHGSVSSRDSGGRRRARPPGKANGETLLYGEHTTVDRLLPAKGLVCVELLHGSTLPEQLPAMLRRRQAAVDDEEEVETKSVVLQYHLKTSKDASPRRHVLALPGPPSPWHDDVGITISAAVVDYLYNGELTLLLLPTTTSTEQQRPLALARVGLSALLTNMGGVKGAYQWEDPDDGRPLGGQARLAIFFKHRQHLGGAAAADGPVGPTGGEAGGGGGGRGGQQVEEAQRGGAEGVATAGEAGSEQGRAVQGLTGGAAPLRARAAEAMEPSAHSPSTPPRTSPLRRAGLFENSGAPSERGTLAASLGAGSLASWSSSSMPAWHQALFPPRPNPLAPEAAWSGPWLAVQVEEAKHLRLPQACLDHPHASQLLLSYTWNRQVVVTPPVPASPAPIWDHYQRLPLPSRRMLHDASLTLELWERPTSLLPPSSVHGSASDERSSLAEAFKGVRMGDGLIGRAVVDLSALTAGLREVDGWYHVTDGLQRLKGQVKVRARVLADDDQGGEQARRTEALVAWGDEEDEVEGGDGGGGPEDLASLQALESLRESVTGLPDSAAPRTPSRVCWHSVASYSEGGGEEEEERGRSPSRAGLEAIHAIVEGLQGLTQELLAPYEQRREGGGSRPEEQQGGGAAELAGGAEEAAATTVSGEEEEEAPASSAVDQQQPLVQQQPPQAEDEGAREEEEEVEEEEEGWQAPVLPIVQLAAAVAEGEGEEDQQPPDEDQGQDEEVEEVVEEVTVEEVVVEEEEGAAGGKGGVTVPASLAEQEAEGGEARAEAAQGPAPARGVETAVQTVRQPGGAVAVQEERQAETVVKEVAIQTDQVEAPPPAAAAQAGGLAVLPTHLPEVGCVDAAVGHADSGRGPSSSPPVPDEAEHYDDDDDEEEEEQEEEEMFERLRSSPPTVPPTDACAGEGHAPSEVAEPQARLSPPPQRPDTSQQRQPQHEAAEEDESRPVRGAAAMAMEEDDVYEDDFDAEDPLSPVRRPRRPPPPPTTPPPASSSPTRPSPSPPRPEERPAVSPRSPEIRGPRGPPTPPPLLPASLWTRPDDSSLRPARSRPAARPEPWTAPPVTSQGVARQDRAPPLLDWEEEQERRGGQAGPLLTPAVPSLGLSSASTTSSSLASPVSPPTSRSGSGGGADQGALLRAAVPTAVRPRRARFADAETERIARIMMGKFETIMGGGEAADDDC